MLLSTPYYRTLTSNNLFGYEDRGEFTYTPYNVFCLETRLSPFVYELLGEDINLIFKTINENNRMALKVEIVKMVDTIRVGEPVPDPELEISPELKHKIQNKVDEIVTDKINYCLISLNNLYKITEHKYPKGWFRSVAGYIPLPDEYNPFFRPEGIYLIFNPKSDYKTEYNRLVTVMVDTIENYWRDGVVYGADSISVPWKLERLDLTTITPRLFQAMWKDSRFAPDLVGFLLDKISGNPYIQVKVSDNLTRRHEVAKVLNKAGIPSIFIGNKVSVPADDLDEAQYICSLIKEAESKASGKTATYAVNSSDQLQDYVAAAQVLLNKPDVAGYQVSDPEKPFMFSCKVGLDVSIRSFINALRDMVGERQSLKK